MPREVVSTNQPAAEWSVVVDESAPPGDLLSALARLLRAMVRREMEKRAQPAAAAAGQNMKPGDVP
jgi:hypothetical protein